MQHDANRAIHFTDERPGFLRSRRLSFGISDDHLTHGVRSVTKELHHFVFDLALDLGDRRIVTGPQEGGLQRIP